MKPGGLKALVLGMGPASKEPEMDDKPESSDMGDDAGLTAAGDDLLAAIEAKDPAAIGRALKDAHRICGGYDEEPPASEPETYAKEV